MKCVDGQWTSIVDGHALVGSKALQPLKYHLGILRLHQTNEVGYYDRPRVPTSGSQIQTRMRRGTSLQMLEMGWHPSECLWFGGGEHYLAKRKC